MPRRHEASFAWSRCVLAIVLLTVPTILWAITLFITGLVAVGHKNKTRREDARKVMRLLLGRSPNG